MYHETERDPLKEAQERWGVDLSNDRAVLQKMAELQGRMPDVGDLSNLWREYQEQREAA